MRTNATKDGIEVDNKAVAMLWSRSKWASGCVRESESVARTGNWFRDFTAS